MQNIAGVNAKMHPKATERMRVRVIIATHRSCDKKQKDRPRDSNVLAEKAAHTREHTHGQDRAGDLQRVRLTS